MNLSQLKIGAASLLPAVATMLFIQACGGGGDAVAQSTGEPIEGVWEAAVTQRDCTTNAALANFRGAHVFHRGGTLTDTNAAPTASRGPGFGTWSRTGSDTYVTKFRFNRYLADGTFAGTQIVNRTVTLSADGNSVAGVSQTLLLDPAGATVGQGCASDASTRFH